VNAILHIVTIKQLYFNKNNIKQFAFVDLTTNKYWSEKARKIILSK